MPPLSPGRCLLAQKKHQNIIMSLKKLYDSEQFLEKLNTLLHLEDIIDIKSFLSMCLNIQEKKLYMLEYQVKNKKKIFINKLNLSNLNILTTKLSKTLDLDLTLKEVGLSPFWNKSSIEKSKKLSLPIMTDLYALDLASYCSSVNTSIQNLQYSKIKIIKNQKMNLQMNLCPLLPTTHQNFMECENMTYSRKIRIYPTAKQKEYFETFFGASRYIYNKTIEWKKNNKDQKSLIFHKIRPHIITANKDLDDNHKETWLKNIPYDTRQLSLKNALSSIKSSIQLLKNKNIQYFNHKFKSKKDKKQTFYIDHRALKNLNLFPSLLKKDKKLKVKKKYKKYENYIPSSDCIILKDGKNYYLLFTKEKEKINITEKKNNIISLDPGIKKFQSFYDTNGYVGEFGNIELKKKLFKTEKKIDKLMSISIKQKKSRLRNKCYKLRTKAKNIISDFHWKLSSFLCKNYKVILLPIFKSKKMRKNLDNISNRVLNLYSHYKFKERMIYQSKKYNCELIIVDESYTTKTCGCCGMINNFIGNSNIFWCSSCKIELDRDYQAARNILIKNTK